MVLAVDLMLKGVSELSQGQLLKSVGVFEVIGQKGHLFDFERRPPAANGAHCHLEGLNYDLRLLALPEPFLDYTHIELHLSVFIPHLHGSQH